MRLGRQLNDALLPLDGSRRRIEGEDFDRLLIEDRYSHFRPVPDRHVFRKLPLARSAEAVRHASLMSN